MMRAWLSVLLARVRGQFSRHADDEFRGELHDHFDRLVEEHLRRGLAPDEARRQARLRLGGLTQIEEQQREQRRLPLADTIGRDLRYALRILRRTPVFTATAVLTLGLGIGATTAMFGLVHAVLLKPLPYAEPDRLVRVFETNPLKGWTRNSASPANYADWQKQNTVFSDVAALEVFDPAKGTTDMFLTGLGEPQRLQASGVSGNMLRMLETAPLLGRTFTDAETFEGSSRVVVLSYGLWQTLFNGDRGVLGRTISLSGRTYDIVGVMPKEFFFPRRDVQLWYPLGYQPAMFVQSRRPHWLTVVARLRPGVSIEQARDQMKAIAAQLERQYPDTNTQMGVRLEPFHDTLTGDARTPLLLLLASVGVLFLIVCVNLASLQIGRIAERAREMAIRQALGAARGRLLGQLLVEGLVVSLAGGAVGLAVAAALHAAIVRFGPVTLPVYADLAFDRVMVVFAGGLALAAPVLFGIAPAVSALRTELLNDRSGAALPRRHALRDALVTCEVALSVVLVIGAGLLLRSLNRLERVDPGFAAERVLTFRLQLPPARYTDAPARARAIERLEQQLKAAPAIAAAGATTTLALGGYTWTGDATVEGRPAADYERELRHESVTAGYFGAMGISLLHGRLFDPFDTADRPPVTIVNETLARKYFRDANPVGRRLKFGRPADSAPWVTVVGVVADARQDGLGTPVRPEVYDPFTTRPMAGVVFAVRTTGIPDAVTADVRTVVAGFDRDLVVTDVKTMVDVVRDSVGDERFRASLAGAFAATALVLAALGLYGVLAYFVTQRTTEIGIRLALGATPSSVFWMVAREAVRPVVPGAVAGLAVAYAASGLIGSLLFGIERLDRPTYLAAGALIGVIAAVAAALPAARAVSVDPIASLRHD